MTALTISDRGRRIPRVCEKCGRDFLAIARHVRNRLGSGRFCSTQCSAANARSARTGSQAGPCNGNWKGGVAKDHMRYKRRFAVKSPEKVRVQRLATGAIKSGRLVRPPVCSQCASACKPHAHHDDYTKPYDVRWLCRLCHNRHHAAIKAARKQAA